MKKIQKSDTLIYWITGLICACVFISIYGIHILNPMYTDWLLAGGDLSQHYLGWKAYRASAWHFPIGMVDTLAYPNYTSVIFTDSIPIFAVFFKILSPVLPADFQYFGFWGILCFILQGVLSVRIIKNFSDNKIVIVLSSIIFAYTPVMIWRMYAHTALAGQWILLLGFEALFVRRKYSGNKRVYGVAALMGLFSSSVHIYFVLMSGIVLVGIGIQDILLNRRIRRAALLLVTYLASAAGVIALLGGFSSEMSATGGGLGTYGFNINGFFNPQGWSCIFQTLPLYGGGQYEGFGYLGAGCILLLLFSLILLGGNTDFKAIVCDHSKEIISIIIIFIVSLVVAFSPVIALNDQTVIEMNLPDFITRVWSIFRASGRVVWVCVYIIMLCSCIALCKAANKRTCTILFAVALALQIYDIHDTLISKYDAFSDKKEYESLLLTQDFWRTIAEDESIEHIIYYTSVDISFMYSVTDWALSNGKTLNSFYFARSISNLIDEARQEALDELGEENLFIFKYEEKMQCLKYDLHYYQVDGVIVGCSKEIGAFPEVTDEFFNLDWSFGDNQYMDEASGCDTEAGRIIYSGGLSYGPYWSVPAGSYSIIITGENMPDNLDVIIYSGHGADYHDFTITQRSESEIKISIAFSEDISDLEICLKNNSENSVTVNRILLYYAE